MAIIIIVVAFLGIFSLAVFSLKTSVSVKESAIANNLAAETIEAIRNFRDATDWNNNGLATLGIGEDNSYYPQLDTSVSPPKWILVEGLETISSFTRKVFFEKVSRDPTTFNIESTYNASHDDPNTRKVITKILWSGKETEISTYFTNWQQ